ncbi:unnamed protein product [Darwinula stevensoni]|uniref:Uncharacterized protein n=1 Tax=Darwinula stevensoni TaxID=69355 RepID=A0A7R9A2Y2_9CRUS|nr:unnamed protein product [Darwinula stevensoni]CAG0889624.1 unnamed protein product [Darwinula stevensoni]
MNKVANEAFGEGNDPYMDTDIRGMNVIFPRSGQRKIGNTLEIIGFMQFPRDKYEGYEGNPGENPADKMRETLKDKVDAILGQMSDSLPDSLGENPNLNYDINSGLKMKPYFDSEIDWRDCESSIRYREPDPSEEEEDAWSPPRSESIAIEEFEQRGIPRPRLISLPSHRPFSYLERFLENVQGQFDPHRHERPPYPPVESQSSVSLSPLI